tara:strand:+ start:29 stop:253 length:225 start_codon:yes stop_codon:yes gene_type:complete
VVESTRQSEVRSNGKKKRRIDQVVQTGWLDRLQNGETMWQEVCALVEASVSRMSANQSTMQKKRSKEKDRAKKS